jgi:ABC-type transporter Mla subunit MlaD
MKARNIGNYVIATLVVLCSLLLFCTLAFALGGFRLTQPGRTVAIDFVDVAGIEPGSRVHLAGKPVGRVSSLRHLTLQERRDASNPAVAVRVVVELDESVPELTENVTAGIASVSFLSPKYVSLDPGPAGASPLPPDAVIVATESGLMETVQQLGDNLGKISSKLNRDYDTWSPRITSLLTRSDGLVTSADGMLENLNAGITNVQELAGLLESDYANAYSPQLKHILAQVQQLSADLNTTVCRLDTNANATLDSLRTLLDDNRTNMAQLIAELRVVSQNLKVTTTYTKALTGRLGERPSAVVFSRHKDIMPSEAEILESPEPVEIEWRKDSKSKTKGSAGDDEPTGASGAQRSSGNP